MAQEAALAVCVAASTYDSDKGATLSSYGYTAAKWRMKRLREKENRHETCRTFHEVVGGRDRNKAFAPRPRVLLDHSRFDGEPMHDRVPGLAEDPETIIAEHQQRLLAIGAYRWELTRIAFTSKGDVTRRTACALLEQQASGEDLNGQTIADAVGCTKQNVNLVHKRAIQRARERLAEEGGIDG
jgi:DNA-directed RNA polymerase specialized sigma24 family protein